MYSLWLAIDKVQYSQISLRGGTESRPTILDMTLISLWAICYLTPSECGWGVCSSFSTYCYLTQSISTLNLISGVTSPLSSRLQWMIQIRVVNWVEYSISITDDGVCVCFRWLNLYKLNIDEKGKYSPKERYWNGQLVQNLETLWVSKCMHVFFISGFLTTMEHVQKYYSR